MRWRKEGGAARKIPAIKTGNAALQIGRVEALRRMQVLLVFDCKLNQRPGAARSGCKHPARDQIRRLCKLAAKNTINQRDQQEDKKFADLCPAAPGIRRKNVGQSRPQKKAHKRNPDTRKSQLLVKNE